MNIVTLICRKRKSCLELLEFKLDYSVNHGKHGDQNKVEPIAHLEWTLGIGLICLAFWNMSIDALGFLLLGIGSDLPDLYDWANAWTNVPLDKTALCLVTLVPWRVCRGEWMKWYLRSAIQNLNFWMM